MEMREKQTELLNRETSRFSHSLGRSLDRLPSTSVLIAGIIWMAAGIDFGAWKTHGFQRSLIDFNLPVE